MNKKICVLGVVGSIDTLVIAKALDDLNIPYDLVLQGRKKTLKKKSIFLRLIALPGKLNDALNVGCYKALPWWSFFKYKKILRTFFFKRSSVYRSLIRPYQNYSPKAIGIHYVPDVNHVKTYALLTKLKPDFGVLAGVGIVDELILECFKDSCFNAHPAPLPQCRGGGALENTFNYNLKPAVSIHYVTAGIDEGAIVNVVNLKMTANDTWDSVVVKLAELSGTAMADVISAALSNTLKSGVANEGKLHLWKHCNLQVQKNAERVFKRNILNLKEANK